VTLTLSTLADAVPPDQIEKHQETVEEARRESVWSLLVAVGFPRPRQSTAFGKLPSPPRKPSPKPGRSSAAKPREGEAGSSPTTGASASIVSGSSGAIESGVTAPKTALASPSAQAGTSPSPRRDRHRRRHRKRRNVLWPIIISVVVIGLIILFIYSLRR
jgi:hypothetical protein